MTVRLLPAFATSLLFMIACGGGGDVAVTPPPAPPAPPAEVAPAAPAPAAAAGEVGVPECDQYIKDMTACLGSMDAATKAAVESSFKQTTDAWRAAAATEAGKAGLAMGCKAALDSMPPNCKAGAAAPAPAADGAAAATATAAPAAGTAAPAAPAATDAKPAEAKVEEKSDHAPHGEKQGKSIQKQGKSLKRPDER